MTIYIFIAIFALFLPLLLSKFIKNVELGVIYYIVAGLLNIVIFYGYIDTLVIIYDINLHFYDYIAVSFYLAAFYRIFLYKINFTNKLLPFVVYFIIEYLYIFISSAHFGQSSFVASRGIIYFLAPTLYFSTFHYSERILKRLYIIFYIYAISLIVLAILRWFGFIPLQYFYSTVEKAAYSSLRALSASQGMDLVFFITISIILILKKKIKFYSHLFPIVGSLLVVLLIQQRIVWVIQAFAFLYLFLKFGKKKYHVVFVLSFSVLSLYFIYNYLGINKHFEEAFYYSFFGAIKNLDQTSGAMRIYQVIYFLKQMTFSDFIYGRFYGAPTIAQIQNIWSSYSIHMYHFEKLFYGGMILFISYVYFQVFVVKKLIYFSKISNYYEFFFKILIIGFLFGIIFTFATGPGLISALIYGISLSIINDKY